MPRRLKLALPWLFTLGILAYLFGTVDLEKVGDALEGADIGTLMAILSLTTVLVFLVDAATLTLLVKRLVTPIRFGEIAAIKGTSYFLNALNYSMASGAVALFLKKKRGVPFLKGVSSLLWLNLVDVMALLVLMSFGLLFAGTMLPEGIANKLPLIIAVGWSVVVGALIYWHLKVDFFVLGRLRTWRIFEVFARANPADYGVLVVSRLAFVMLYVLMNWLALPTFGIHIDLGTILIYTPILTFVQIVPASISGLGAIQVVMVALYSQHIDTSPEHAAAMVIAFSTVVGPTISVLRLVIGYAFLSNVARDFVPRQDEIAKAQAEATKDPER